MHIKPDKLLTNLKLHLVLPALVLRTFRKYMYPWLKFTALEAPWSAAVSRLKTIVLTNVGFAKFE